MDEEKRLWKFQKVEIDPVTGLAIIPAGTHMACSKCLDRWDQPKPRKVPPSGIRCHNRKCHSREIYLDTGMGKKEDDGWERFGAMMDRLTGNHKAETEAGIMARMKKVTPTKEEKEDDPQEPAPEPPAPEPEIPAVMDQGDSDGIEIADSEGILLTEDDPKTGVPVMAQEDIQAEIAKMMQGQSELPQTGPVHIGPSGTTIASPAKISPAGKTINGEPVIKIDQRAVKMAATSLTNMITYVAEKLAMEDAPQELVDNVAESIGVVLYQYKDYLEANQYIMLVFCGLSIGRLFLWSAERRKHNKQGQAKDQAKKGKEGA